MFIGVSDNVVDGTNLLIFVGRGGRNLANSFYFVIYRPEKLFLLFKPEENIFHIVDKC